MKKVYPFLFFMVATIIISCQGNIVDKKEPTESLESSKETEPVLIHVTVTPIADKINLKTPVIVTPEETEVNENIIEAAENTPPVTDIQVQMTPTPIAGTPLDLITETNFLPELEGKIFIGSHFNGVYFELNFEDDQVILHKLPAGCHILPSGEKAVCTDVNPPNLPVTYVYNVLSNQIDFQFDEKGGIWYLASAKKLLEYILYTENIGSIYVYDFDSKKSSYIGDFIQQSLTNFPQISNSSKLLIGLDYQKPHVEEDDRWNIVQLDTLTTEPVLAPGTIVATESFAWAPDDTSVALIGYDGDEGSRTHAGTLVCGRVALIYDPVTRSVVHSVEMPEQRCVTPFTMYSAYSDQFWSTDSSKLALILDQQGQSGCGAEGAGAAQGEGGVATPQRRAADKAHPSASLRMRVMKGALASR
jgi:hypothetical protein